jgi:peptidyl-prolyl cis-trans isomerase A (cyclophilin A)
MKSRKLSVLVACSLIVAFGINLIGQDKPENKKAPSLFQVKFETTVGDFTVEVHRDWSPNGADRFYTLVSTGFYDDCKFFRAIDDFMIQFGINGDPEVTKKWHGVKLKDDPVIRSNKRGFVTFAKANFPNSRSTQVFINTKRAHNTFLDSMGFSPFGEVIEGMDVVDQINTEYDNAPLEFTPNIMAEGNKFLEAKFPRLDGIKKATIIPKKAVGEKK